VTKKITEPELASDKVENNRPVKEESFEDTLKSEIPEIKEMESSVPALGHETENESLMTGKWVKDDSLKGQRASVEKTPSNQMALAPELDSEREYFQQVLKVEEKSDSRAQVYFEKGVLYQRQRKLDQAIDFYKKALALNPGHQQAQVKLASVLIQTGRFEEAKALLTPLNALNP
jgi:tetratricopeptide (TPR) repeat protein